MKLSEFDYNLPKDLIAQYPARERHKCRLMVLDRKAKSVSHTIFEGISSYFAKGDLLILNNTKVIPARLFGKRKTGGRVELFLLNPLAAKLPVSRSRKEYVCEALIKPSARIKDGEIIALDSGDEAEVLGPGEVGRMVKFGRPVDDIMIRFGHVPLPPYIDRPDEEDDKDCYQTVYADREGATASPTAGLHFTKELLSAIEKQGIRICHVTLHTNYGTFAPVKTENVEDHKMHREYFELSSETVGAVLETKKRGRKVFAVGTTTARVLEHCSVYDSRYGLSLKAMCGYNDLFIYPGYEFKIIDCLITNFHLPKSTLMLLVSALAGKDFIFKAYREAIVRKYRFFSYGDAMLIL